MSERMYFSFKYSLPGYTFLILLLLININFFVSIIQYSNNTNLITLLGLVLGIISLLGGSALGILISQLWYFIANYIMKPRFSKKKYQYIKEVIGDMDEFKIFSNQVIVDYILNKYSDKNIQEYFDRRNDLISSLGSTFFAFFIGLIVGYFLKYFILNIYCNIFNIDAVIILSSIISMIVICLNLIIIYKELDLMSKMVIYINREKIKKHMKGIETKILKL